MAARRSANECNRCRRKPCKPGARPRLAKQKAAAAQQAAVGVERWPVGSGGPHARKAAQSLASPAVLERLHGRQRLRHPGPLVPSLAPLRSRHRSWVRLGPSESHLQGSARGAMPRKNGRSWPSERLALGGRRSRGKCCSGSWAATGQRLGSRLDCRSSVSTTERSMHAKHIAYRMLHS